MAKALNIAIIRCNKVLQYVREYTRSGEYQKETGRYSRSVEN